MKFAPLYFVIGYIALTFLLIVAGPVIYFGFNAAITGVFLIFVIAAMAFGYIAGVNRLDAEVAREVELSKSAHSILPLFHICLTISLGALIILIAEALLGGTVNFSASDLGSAYVESYAGYVRNSGNYSFGFLVTTAAAPFNFIATVWGIYYFKQLRTSVKGAVLVLVIGTLLFYTVGSGKQKQLGDTVIYLIAIGAIIHARSGRSLSLKAIVPALVGGVAALFGFVAILGQRYAALSVDALTVNSKSNRLQFVDLDHPLFKLFGMDTGFSLALFSSYLSQGYFGLSMALESDFTWSYMLGFSYSVMVVADRLFGLPWVFETPYPYQVGAATGWAESKWHSAFAYWASDFTFPGTVVLFGFFGYIFARCWNESFRLGNPFAILLFSLMTMGAFFLPANNQLFISPGSVVTVIVVAGLYIAYRKRFNEASRALMR